MSRVPAEVIGITVAPPYQGFLLILREVKGIRWLPIFIGQPEAQNISHLLKSSKSPRPLTFDLIGDIISLSNTKIESISVVDLRDDTFIAEIEFISADGRHSSIDARPSDAVALALKTCANIYIEERVLVEAGKSNEFELTDSDDEDVLKKLNKDLQSAIDKEAYEDAAKIRDQIKELESAPGKSRANV